VTSEEFFAFAKQLMGGAPHTYSWILSLYASCCGGKKVKCCSVKNGQCEKEVVGVAKHDDRLMAKLQ